MRLSSTIKRFWRGWNYACTLAVCAAWPAGALAKHHHHHPELLAPVTNTTDNSITVSGQAVANAGDNGSGALISTFIVLGGVALIAALIVVMVYRNMRDKRASARSARAITERNSTGLLAADRFLVSERPTYPFISKFERCRLLMMNADATHIRFLSYNTAAGEMSILTDLQMSLTDIVSIDLIRHDEKMTQHQSQTSKNGVFARAVIGEALGGSTGAIVGAISAPTKTSTTSVEVNVHRFSELVFGLADLHHPVRRFRSTDHAALDEWLFRIKSAQFKINKATAEGGSEALPRVTP